jgi:hypothetical protein
MILNEINFFYTFLDLFELGIKVEQILNNRKKYVISSNEFKTIYLI